MAKAKSLGGDAPAKSEKSQAQESTIDLRRIINNGVEVVVSSGTYTIKEMPAVDMLVFLLDSVEVVQGLFSGSGNGLETFKLALADPAVQYKLADFFAKSAGSTADKFSSLSMSDFIKLIAACKQAYDWETLQKGFTELGLTEAIQTYLSQSQTSLPESSLSS